MEFLSCLYGFKPVFSDCLSIDFIILEQSNTIVNLARALTTLVGCVMMILTGVVNKWGDAV